MPAAPIYRVELELFEGPLDLLLFLIQREEVDIYDIPIARIARQYVEYLDLMRALDLDVVGEFILMASTLMAIKSRMLLPATEVNEEGELVDPREDLVRQLLEYRRFRAAAERLDQIQDERRQVHIRGLSMSLPEAPEAELELGLYALLSAYQTLLNRAQIRAAARPQLELEELRIEDRVRLIRKILRETARLRLSELLHDAREKLEVIVTFIAILELVRLGEVGVRQPTAFEEVYLHRRGSSHE